MRKGDERMNEVRLKGRLTDNPIFHPVKEGEENDKDRVWFVMATNRRYRSKQARQEAADAGKQTADFPPCVSFGKQARAIANHCRKGKEVLLTNARLQTYIKEFPEESRVEHRMEVIIAPGGIEFGNDSNKGKQGDVSTEAAALANKLLEKLENEGEKAVIDAIKDAKESAEAQEATPDGDTDNPCPA
jgi:single-strand DNA-binding protein